MTSSETERTGAPRSAQIGLGVLVALLGFFWSASLADEAGMVGALVPLLLAGTVLGVVIARLKGRVSAGGQQRGFGVGAMAGLGLAGGLVATRASEPVLFWLFLVSYVVGVTWISIVVKQRRAERRDSNESLGREVH